MKLLIASDIHGSAHWCRKLTEAFAASGADKLILLGDVLYHGPRNDLPDAYAPKEVIDMLNPLADRIICVRGNCESEVDGMVLSFPVSADYGVVAAENTVMYLSHGHREVPKMVPGTVYLTGHTHVPLAEVTDGYIHLNPGSVSIPKENSPHSYMLYENGLFTWHDLENGAEYKRYTL
ncbi:MAG: phosphodiesterase [Clostridia bacterium]|nr:phosphodiesterase [Clostridia bacterium]